MRITIDATILRKENTGTGFYITNLINGLGEVDKSNKYYIFGNKYLLEGLVKVENDNFEIIHRSFKNRFFRIFWQLFIFPFSLWFKKVDILHSPNYITPLVKLVFKSIVTIHDMTIFLFPEKHSKLRRLFFRFMMPIFIKKADKILAVSNNTKKDILRLLKVDGKKIAVIYESISEYYNNIKKLNLNRKILEKYGIYKDFILFVGMIEPRKNILLLLKAFIELDSELDLDLVIVGKKGWYFKNIEDFTDGLNNKNLKNKVIFTGYVPENELKYFYQSAYIFVYPSLYEGFGLPPLEAMACGTPVITSNVSSLPEVVGDAAIKINPNDLEELIRAIRLLYTDKSKREELITKGFEQSKKFDANDVARRVISIYESLC